MNISEFLRKVFEYESPPSVNDLADDTGISKAGISKKVSKCCKKGLIKKECHENGGSRVSIYLTEAGKNRIIQASSCPQEVNGVNSERTVRDSYDDDRYFIHNFEVGVDLRNHEMLDDSWKERAMEYEDLDVSLYDSMGETRLIHDEWIFRITNEKVHIRVRHEITGADVRNIKDQMMDRARDGIEFIEERLPLKLSSNPQSIRVNSQHIGIIGHHLARHIDDHMDADVSDFRVRDDDGELLMWIDRSNGRLELEAGNGGSPSGKRETAEDDIAFMEEWSYKLRSNKSKARSLFSDIDDLDRAVKLLLARELRKDRESSDNTEYDNPVQELFMEYWRDSDYNRPFFHSQSGGLMVFRSDGSGCEKILSGDAVRRLKSDA